MERFKWLAGMGLTALLLCFPEAAASGAREALRQWYLAVAPALFPFMALMPLLTCDEALSAYARLLGGAARRLFGLPGQAAPALAIGLLAGSPAGCLAAARAARSGGLRRGQLERLALACCGLSPGFLITGVGAGLLGSAGAGRVLLRSQIACQLLLLALLRFIISDGEALPRSEAADGDGAPLRGAVLAVLGVGGWMALFGALGGAARAMVGREAEAGLMGLMEVSSGARALCALPLPAAPRLALLSAVMGFGGLCVGLQNLSTLEGFDISRRRYFLTRLLAAALNAGFTWLQLPAGAGIPGPVPDPLRLGCLSMCAVALPALILWKRTESLQ